MRNRVSIQDLGLVLAVVLVLTYIAFEVDIFVGQGNQTSGELKIDLDEALLIGGTLAVGLLIFAFRRYLEQRREMARRLSAERRSRELAYLDPLTGLANRRQFDEALRTAAASPPKSGASHGIFLLDLNGFKRVNDTFGHGVGDEVLVVVSQRLTGAVREGALVARLGGDEFIILANHLAGPEAATNVAMRIIQALSEPIVAGGVKHEIGAGIGIALLPADAHTADEALRRADVALYRAKAERRSAFRFFEEDMDRLVRERQLMELQLRLAIGSDQIRPRFRPSVDLKNGDVVSFEALPHWEAPDGEVPPERFISIAQEAGLIHLLARRLFRRACEAATNWPEHVKLSIDILPGQFEDRDLWMMFRDELATAGFRPDRLEIEVTESMIVHDLETAKLALGPLRDMGVCIVLDNFGTGYSSLYHMQEFKLDRVKIDRRFMEDGDAEASGRIVKALAGLGHGLGLGVSAEASWDGSQNSALIGSGVEVGQATSRPMTEEEAMRFVTRKSIDALMRQSA